MRHTGTLRRPLAYLLAACLLAALLPAPALAAEGAVPMEGPSAPGPAAYDEAAALFAALPAPEAVADMTDGEKDALSARLAQALDALEALPGEDYARFLAEHGDYMELAAALQTALTGGTEPLDAHTHCVCGGGVRTGGHTSHEDGTVWTAWTETTSLPTTAGNYYLTQNVALTTAWTAPAGTVNLCLNGKTVTGSAVKTAATSTYACVDIPSGADLTVCDCGSSGGMNFAPSYVGRGNVTGIYGGTGSSFTLYSGGVSASRSAQYAICALYNNGGTFAIHGGTVSAAHNSSGADKSPFAYCVRTDAGTTTLWGGSFEAKVTNTASHTDGNSGAYGARALGTGILRLAGAPTFTASNSANREDAGAISTLNNQPYAHAEDTPFSGDSVRIRVSSDIARDGGLVVREVEASNKDKFTVTNATSLTLTEVTEDGKTHLALTGPYTVQFNANGGTGTMANQSFDGYTHSQALAQNAFTKTGYRFTGWNAKADGSGTAYAEGAAVSALAYGGAVTLYAQWAALPPDASAAVIDYKNETISYDSDLYEMNAAENFTGAAIASGASITDYISNYNAPPQKLYIRVKAAGNIPAGAATAVPIPARPRDSAIPTYSVGDTTITIDASYNETIEHTIDDWTTINTGSYIYRGLNPGTDYTLKFRVPATGESFKSKEREEPSYTAATIQKPTVSEPGKGSAEADKPIKRRGKTVTYTVTFTDGWTPTLTLSGNNNALSDPVKGENNTWTYTYVVHKDDKIIGAAVTFAQPQIESVSYTGDPVALFADSEHNASADALKAYLDASVKVTPAYDNGATGEAVAATYELKTGNTWAAQGGTYTYAATAGGQTCDVPVAVKPVTAAPGPVDGITKVRTAEGYASHAALGLPGTVGVTYTGGEGYTERTDTLPVSWDAIPQDFGKTTGSHTFTGTVTLPAWATYTANTTSATVTISDKTPLTGDQMPLTMDGWTYGETAETPNGSVTVTDENGVISYQYSADNGTTWTASLPLSPAGFAKAGGYLVKMSYEGDAYIGEKTAAFTVAQKAVTLGVGTLAATKPYDGDTDAALTGAPALTGVLSGDTVEAADGGGAYATADVGTDISVTVTGFTLTGADAGNYATDGAVSGLTGTITPAEGTTAPDYAAALAELQKVHIVTNVTPTLADVTLPDGWAFTGDKNARITASSDNGGRQPFPVEYTPASANYAPVLLTGDDALFPVSTVALEVNGGLDMRTIDSINGTLTLSPVALKVTGAALPASGDFAISNMEWSSSVTRIATVTGSVAASGMSATITAVNKGVTMVGVAYKNGGGMLGYVLVQVVDNRTDSANTVEDITSITETLDKLIDPERPSATDKAAVDAVADEVTKLPEKKKAELKREDVEALNALKEAVGKNVSDPAGKLNITIDKAAEGQAPAPSNVEVVGAAIACGVDSGNVVVTVKPVRPTSSDTKLELKMELTVDNAEAKLAAPMFFQMDVPEGIDLAKLTLYHARDNGSKTVLPFTIVSGRTIAFKMLSFSSVRFVIPTGGTTGGGSTGGGGGGSTTYYTLTATAGEGGTISPGGKVRVSRNGGKTFTVTPDEGYGIADVLVDGESVGAVGTYTFEKVRANHTIAARFRAEDERPAWNPFADVKEGAWYYDSVRYVYERGLMNGAGETTFSPGLPTTRGMLVTILWRLEQSPDSGADMAFADVTAGSYCFDAVRWGAEHEIVKGYTATAFGPDNIITRQELAAILYRYARYKGYDAGASGDLTAFADRPDPWAEDAVNWAVGAGILTGRGNGVFDPRGHATRAEAAAMLQRFAEGNAM